MNKNKSFTLIELLVVIVIIGILAGVIMISTSSSIDKSNFAKAQAFSSTIQNELLSNLVSEWTFDEPQEGNITKDSWGNSHGTVVGATQVDDCVFGKCYSFDGTSDVIKILDKPEFNLDDQASVFVWVRANSSISTRVIFSQWDYGINQRQWVILTDAGGGKKLRVYISSDGTLNNIKDYTTINDIFDNSWRYVGFVWDKGVLKLYVDGREMGVTKTKDLAFTSMFNSSVDVMMGCWLNNNQSINFFPGVMDNVRIYNAALSSSQIKQNYIAGLESLLSKGTISSSEFKENIAKMSSNR